MICTVYNFAVTRRHNTLPTQYVISQLENIACAVYNFTVRKPYLYNLPIVPLENIIFTVFNFTVIKHYQ